VWSRPLRVQFLPQSALPEVPGSGTGRVARSAAGRAASGALLPRRVHSAGADRRDRLPEQGDGLRHPVPEFRTAAETLRIIAADPAHLGAEIGLLAVLHTWGQNLHLHPHVHCVVPGGGLSLDGTRWVACRPGFFLPVRVLSRLFRRLFLAELDVAFAAGRLGFFGALTGLANPAAFARRLNELRRRRGGWRATP